MQEVVPQQNALQITPFFQTITSFNRDNVLKKEHCSKNSALGTMGCQDEISDNQVFTVGSQSDVMGSEERLETHLPCPAPPRFNTETSYKRHSLAVFVFVSLFPPEQGYRTRVVRAMFNVSSFAICSRKIEVTVTLTTINLS
jgi:hypothetical protein